MTDRTTRHPPRRRPGALVGSGTGWTSLALAALVAPALAGCPDDDPEPLERAEGIYAPLGDPRPNATDEEKATFERGFETAIKRFSPEDGLGPHFNLTFCIGCHEKPVFGGSGPRYRDFTLVEQELPDGTTNKLGVNGVQPHYDLESADGVRFDSPEGVNVRATRNAIPFFGVGLIAEIPEESILANADPDDLDGDGISGRPNWDRGFVGRFGRKAQTVSIEGFIRGPLFNHLGLTSNPLSNEMKALLPVPSALTPEQLAEQEGTGEVGTQTAGQAAAPDEPLFDDDGVPDPEFSEQELFDLVSWSMLLAPPAPEDPTEQSLRGEQHFEAAGCASCHTPMLDSERGGIPLYSDLLLHDMGEDRADGVRMGVALGAEYRTQPLWGVVATPPYLHDGAADTLDEAIRLHGGEGAASRDAYLALDAEGQADVIEFLSSLGGRDQWTAGLIPPDEPTPEVGTWGGPEFELSDEDLARFEEGRRVFDRDMHRSEGLGLPGFNGDACRACHFDPVVGGSGPLGLDVQRQGIYDAESDVFTMPEGGTLLHRFSADGSRPEPSPMATHFERRQSPSVLGIGALSRISEATILAGEDLGDVDGDGVRGRAHVLHDGRIGRFGWKAQVPSPEEFARDALTAELGLTLPARDGQSFGRLTDSDGVPDPEVSDAHYDALVFWLEHTAPPPGQSTDADREALGGQAFADVGCATCHVPSLPDADGVPVRAYTDLLLHEILPENAWGIADDGATMREFRTPPLWGTAFTGPWMHDGAAPTLHDAIVQHDGTASVSRDAYLALDEDDRGALIAFLESL